MATYIKVAEVMYRCIDEGLTSEELNMHTPLSKVGEVRYIKDALYRVAGINKYKSNLHIFTKQRYDFYINWVKV